MVAALLTFVSVCGLPVLAQGKPPGEKRGLALVGATVYRSPSEAPIPGGVVLIEDEKIVGVGERNVVKVPAGVETLDCTGCTIVAGFWNCHVHFTEPKWANAAGVPAAQVATQIEQMLTRYGFTSVVDTASLLANTNALRHRIDSGEVDGPRILTAGLALYPPDGVPYYVRDAIDPSLLALLPQPATPEEAVKRVDELAAQGADIIKLFVVSWVRRDGRLETKPMPAAVVQAATAEAHRKGRLVFAHPSTIEGVELVLQGHVDVLAHTIEDPEHWTDSTVARLKAADVSLVPTLALFSPDGGAEGILHEVKSYSEAGGRILFGTDVGYLTDYDRLGREFELLARAGLTFPQILASLTTAPAERLGFGARSGRIAKGMDADLVALDGDPAQDVRAFARVKYTVRAGRVIYAPAGR